MHPHPPDKDSIFVYFDGLCEPKNPGGVATFGVVVKRGEETIFEDSGIAFAEPWTAEASNNVAEYSAIIHGLEWLDLNHLNSSCIVLRGDSRLVVNQLLGLFKVKAMRIVELYQRAVKLLARFKDIHIEWVERSKNKEADLLSRIAYSKYTKAHKMER